MRSCIWTPLFPTDGSAIINVYTTNRDTTTPEPLVLDCLVDSTNSALVIATSAPPAYLPIGSLETSCTHLSKDDYPFPRGKHSAARTATTDQPSTPPPRRLRGSPRGCQERARPTHSSPRPVLLRESHRLTRLHRILHRPTLKPPYSRRKTTQVRDPYSPLGRCAPPRPPSQAVQAPPRRQRSSAGDRILQTSATTVGGRDRTAATWWRESR